MYIKDRLKILIKLLGLKIKDFSNKTGIPYQSLLKYLSGERTPTEENLQKMAIHLGVNLNWLLTGEGEPFIKHEISKDAIPIKKIPVVARVPAGFPNIVSEQVIEYIHLPDIPDNALAVIAKGESMSPLIKDGDYVIFLPMPVDIFPGDIVIVNNDWGETMIKRYKIKDNTPYLVSENPEYPTYQPNEHYKIVGKAISVWRKIKI